MENSQATTFIYNKNNCKWNEKILTQQLSNHNGTKIFEFTDNVQYLSDIPNTSDGKGIIYIYHDKTSEKIIPLYFISRKFHLNDGNKFIPSQMPNLLNDKSSHIHNHINNLNYLEFQQLVPTMNWIKNVIVKLIKTNQNMLK